MASMMGFLPLTDRDDLRARPSPTQIADQTRIDLVRLLSTGP
jgi:hypothetical protein